MPRQLSHGVYVSKLKPMDAAAIHLGVQLNALHSTNRGDAFLSLRATPALVNIPNDSSMAAGMPGQGRLGLPDRVTAGDN